MDNFQSVGRWCPVGNSPLDPDQEPTGKHPPPQRVIQHPRRLPGCCLISNANYLSDRADSSSPSCTAHGTNGTICLAGVSALSSALLLCFSGSLAEFLHTDGAAAASESGRHLVELLWKLFYLQHFSSAVCEYLTAKAFSTATDPLMELIVNPRRFAISKDELPP